MSQNQLFETTLIATGEKVRVYLLSNSSKEAGKWCNYDDMSKVYARAELAEKMKAVSVPR
jgi:hypothetical protein